MILTDRELSLALHGWVETETIDGYRFFYRFTKKQMDYYQSSRFHPKQRASAGIYMEFVTDAEELCFEYRQDKASSQNFYFFDLLIDGKMVFHDGKDVYSKTEEGIYEKKLPAGEKTLKLYFPNLSATGIRKVTLENATLFRPTEKSLTYVAYGDSITQGYASLSPSLTYVNLVGDALNADVYNLGIGGELFEPLMVDEAYPVKGDLVTVAYGTNDWSHTTPEEDKQRRKGFFEGLIRTQKGAKIFVLLPIWRGNGNGIKEGYGTLENYRETMRQELKQYPEITVIEGENLVPHHGDFFMPDLLHPNALGFTQYARNLLTELKKHL